MPGSARPRPRPWRIAIAGAGLPSLALAAALARFGGEALTVAVFDPAVDRPLAARPDARAFALSTASVRLLEALEVWPAVAARAEPITAMTITDSRTRDVVRPDYLGFEDAAGTLGWMVEASVLGPALAQACAAAGTTFVAAPITGFSTGASAITLEGVSNASRVSLLVAADGARSRLREASGIGWVGRAYGQSAIVATIRHTRPHGGRAVQHFLPAGPFAILPLTNDARDPPHRSSIVWTETRAEANALLAGSPAAVLPTLEERFGAGYGALSLDTPLASHPLAVGLPRSFVAERFALLGDAAHEIHPLAGQGLNLGLADAAALAERIVAAVRLGLDPGAADVLAAYERDRRAAAVALAGATDGLNRLFSNDSLPVRFARDLGLGLVDRTPALKRWFAGAAAGDARDAPRLTRGEPI